jgi:hypothetical protein
MFGSIMFLCTGIKHDGANMLYGMDGCALSTLPPFGVLGRRSFKGVERIYLVEI